MVEHRTPRARIEIAARTDRGLERSDNEDSLAVVSLGRRSAHHDEFAGEEALEPGGVLLAVCDGMGGEAGGEVASRQAVETIRRIVLGAGPIAVPERLARVLLDSLHSAAREVKAIARARPEIRRMGTTATVCGIVDGELVIGQVGDSRAYLLRRGRLTQLTRDQTLAAMLVERGQLQAADVRGLSCGHVIIQALGTSDSVEVDLTSVPVCRGDVLLVCSDGLAGPVEDEAICQALLAAATAREASDALVALAIAAGGPDNVTCIVARIDGEALPQPDDSPPVARKVCLPLYDVDATLEMAALCAEDIEPPDTEPAPAAPNALGRLRDLFRIRRR